MVKLPSFLKPRRKYEVNESHWLVIYMRPRYEKALVYLRPKYERMKTIEWRVFLNKWEAAFATRTRSKFEGLGMVFRWKGLPKSWEASFVRKMDGFEKEGITFAEVLRETSPKLFGDVPAEVLRRWIGSKARRDSIRFAKTMSKMFGGSARAVLDSLQALADDNEILDSKIEQVTPAQYLMEKMASLGITN